MRDPCDNHDGAFDAGRPEADGARRAKHSSSKDNHMTPKPFTDAARQVMGGIDVDPATTEFANRAIGAKAIYTVETSGHNKPWYGSVFLNPPGGALRVAERGTKSRAVSWWIKLVEERVAMRTKQAIFLAFSLEFLQAVQKIKGGCTNEQWPLNYCACFVESRIPFELEADALAAELREERALLLSDEATLDTGLVSLLALSAPKREKLAKIDRRIRECEENAGGRVAGDQPTHGNVIVYMPPDVDRVTACARFEHHFRQFGRIHNPSSSDAMLEEIRQRIERAAAAHEDQARTDGFPKRFQCADVVKADTLRRFAEVFLR